MQETVNKRQRGLKRAWLKTEDGEKHNQSELAVTRDLLKVCHLWNSSTKNEQRGDGGWGQKRGREQNLGVREKIDPFHRTNYSTEGRELDRERRVGGQDQMGTKTTPKRKS